MSLGIRQQLGKSKTRGKQLLHRSDNLTPKWNDDTKSYLLSFLPQLEKELDRLKNLFLEWENHVNEMDDDADRDTEQQLFDSWKEDEEYVNLISDLECTINFGQSIKEPTKPIDTKIPAKIAVQDIKKFDGDYMKWNPFWQRFVLNIDSKSYAPIDKLDTLLGLLDGKAYDEVQGFAVIGENYDAVKQTLIDRYGNNKRVIYELQNKLHMIPPAKATATSLRETITSITNVCRQMENLGIDLNNATTKWEIIRKMPTEERNELSIAYQTEQETTTNDILKKMKQYKLKAEIRAQTEKESYSYPDSPPSFKFARSPSKKWVCSFCNDNHPSGACDKFKSIAERINQLRSQQRCFKCAGRYHSSKECRANVTCQHCNGNHRSFLCDKSKSRTVTKTNAFLAAERIQVLHQNQSPLLAKEITVKNPDNNKEAKAVVLLDSGSQQNYVSNDLVKKLGLQPLYTEYINVEGFGGKKTHHQSTRVQIRIPTIDSNYLDINAYTIPSIAADIPMAEIKTDDPLQYSIAKKTPDILVGMEDFFFIVTAAKEQNGIFIIDSKIGKMISGKLTEQETIVSCPVIPSPSAAGENLVELENTVPLDEWWELHKKKHGSPKLLPGQFYLE